MVTEQIARRLLISGSVQGVGYRFFAQDVAARLGIAGYVRNLFDGRVEVYAIGDAKQIEELQVELQRGPRMASVSQVDVSNAELLPEYSHNFTIEQSN
jgi:acylphosphatase